MAYVLTRGSGESDQVPVAAQRRRQALNAKNATNVTDSGRTWSKSASNKSDTQQSGMELELLVSDHSVVGEVDVMGVVTSLAWGK